MKPRDLALVGAVLVLAAVAVADAVRSDGSTPSPPAAPTTTAAETEEEEAEGRREIFPDVPARGSLAFTEADDCRLRDVSVSTGIEFPLPRIVTSCDLWAPPLGDRIAYGLGQASGQAVPFRFVNLGRALDDLGEFRARFEGVVWSRDGQRAAWCDDSRTGYDYELGNDVRRLDGCPRAYTPDGQVAFVRGRELVVGGRIVLTASGSIRLVSWGTDGSLALLLDERRLERWDRGRLAQAVTIPPSPATPVLSPDNCAALLIDQLAVRLLDIGCFRGRRSFTNVSPDNCLNRRQVNIALCARFPAPRTFVGTTAVWSPDGEWIAVAEATAIAFHRVVGRYDAVRWDAEARRLAWH